MFNWIKDNPIFFLLIFLAIAAPSLFFGALRVVFYIILAIVILLFILSLIFRAKITRLQDEMNKQGTGSPQDGFYSNRTYSSNNNRTQTDEGEVKIFKQRGAGEKRVSGSVGDYVEFEEIEEEN
ncbi:MAG: DUF4834 family protein [Rikenellaceae bacterium]